MTLSSPKQSVPQQFIKQNEFKWPKRIFVSLHLDRYGEWIDRQHDQIHVPTTLN